MPKKFRIGHLSTAYHTSLILMGAGWVEERLNVQVEWQLYGTGPAIVQAFEKGNLDLAYIGLTPVIIGVERGMHFKCVAGGHVEGTVLVARDAKDLGALGSTAKVLRQLEGSTIGVPQQGSIHDVILREEIRKTGLENRVAVKNYAWTDFVLDALADNEVRAAAGTPALAVAAKRGFGAKIVIPPSALWKNNPSYGIIASAEMIKESSTLLEGFLKLHEEASNLIRSNPAKAAKIAASVAGVVDEDFVREAYCISPHYCASLSPEFIASTVAFVPVLLKLGYVSRPPQENEIFDKRFIEKVHHEAPHY